MTGGEGSISQCASNLLPESACELQAINCLTTITRQLGQHGKVKLTQSLSFAALHVNIREELLMPAVCVPPQ